MWLTIIFKCTKILWGMLQTAWDHKLVRTATLRYNFHSSAMFFKDSDPRQLQRKAPYGLQAKVNVWGACRTSEETWCGSAFSTCLLQRHSSSSHIPSSQAYPPRRAELNSEGEREDCTTFAQWVRFMERPSYFIATTAKLSTGYHQLKKKISTCPRFLRGGNTNVNCWRDPLRGVA